MKINQLGTEIKKLLDEYKGLTFDVIDESLEVVQKETISLLQSTSPRNKGVYYKRWRAKRDRTTSSRKLIISNSKYQLTHLLEKPHKLRNGKMSRSFEHVKPAQDVAEKRFEEELKKGLKNG